MLYARGPLRTLQLAALLAIVSASSIRPGWVLKRADTCAANYSKCSQAGLPGNFCCQTGSSCKVLAGATTVLCCPDGSDCSTIQIISCNLSLQDPASHPQAEVKTTELDGKLPTCGKGCCPFGYHCDAGNANCVMDKDQSKKPGGASSSAPSPTSTVHPSSTLSTGTASTSTAAAAVGTDETPAPATETPSPAAANTLNTAAIVGGVVGGLLVIALVIAGVWLLRHKRKKAEAEREKRDTTESFGNIISAPIPHADYHTQRLDFLAKAQSSSVSSSPTQVQGRFPPSSPYSTYAFRPGSEMTDRPRSYHASAEIGGLRNLTDRYSSGSIANPFTPRDKRQNSGGSESINIFADPSTVGSPSIYNRRDTTWTEFQHHADQRGLDSPVPPIRKT
ncbi:hypothetical protein E0Z10_g4709 [Xylaria hypoxylon]|uniref:Mid2 domain-containing protein n=1 Tax=Xylaria hypoxylon TaxID=37992 RepID=A0A4Z0YXC7_9PEZI|nr:hypothetical protein E0Z10_g4709 [Xylaria hypoxylon]